MLEFISCLLVHLLDYLKMKTLNIKISSIKNSDKCLHEHKNHRINQVHGTEFSNEIEFISEKSESSHLKQEKLVWELLNKYRIYFSNFGANDLRYWEAGLTRVIFIKQFIGDKAFKKQQTLGVCHLYILKHEDWTHYVIYAGTTR